MVNNYNVSQENQYLQRVTKKNVDTKFKWHSNCRDEKHIDLKLYNSHLKLDMKKQSSHQFVKAENVKKNCF